MILHTLPVFCFLAVALVGPTAQAQDALANPVVIKVHVLQWHGGTSSMHASVPKAYDTALQNAFECRSVAPDIDLALQAREIVMDGQTHATLDPPITVLGFTVNDVTVFRDSGEDVYAIYLKNMGAAIAATLKKSTWPGATGFTASSLPGGVTRLACSISPGASAGEAGDGD